MNKNLQDVLTAALLVVAQIFLFNNIQLRGMLDSFVAPCVYIMFILLMPMGTSQVKMQFTAFALGFSVDFMSGTLGMNTAACVLIGFLRPTALKLLFNREERNKGARPTVYLLGRQSFLLYAFALAFVFHLTLCFIEVFTLYEFYFTILRALLSAAASALLIVMVEYLFEKKERRYR
jgi:rod shape-determining protein MreD